MTTIETQNLISLAITQYGLAVLGIITAIIVIAVAYLVFKFGWSRLINDQSLCIGGYYVRNKPYKNYNRFRSQSWNMRNTL